MNDEWPPISSMRLLSHSDKEWLKTEREGWRYSGQSVDIHYSGKLSKPASQQKTKELEKYSIEVYNSRRPLDRLTLTLTFDLIGLFIGGRGIVLDYLCANFGDFTFTRFCFILRTDRQNHRQNHRGVSTGNSILYERDTWQIFQLLRLMKVHLIRLRLSCQWWNELVKHRDGDNVIMT